MRRVSSVSRTAFTAVAGALILASCGGAAGVVIEVKAGDAYRLAEATVVRAAKKSENPSVADLHTAFEKERETTSLPENWELHDLDASNLEVRLMLPEDTASGGSDSHAAGFVEGVIASEETTTTVAGTESHSESTTTTGKEGEKPVVTEAESHSTESTVSSSTEESTKKGSESTVTTTEPVKMKVAMAACIHKNSEGWESSSEPCEVDEGGHEAEAHPAGHWSYSGDTGPAKWGELSEEYKLCVDGSAQTPIDVVVKDAVPQDLKDPAVSYTAGLAKVENNGHTVVVAASGGSVVVEGTEYPFAQMHFHAMSEHTVDGKHWPVEMHFVHKREDGKIAVIGVMVEEGTSENKAWKPVVDNLSVNEGATAETVVDWSALLPEGRATFRYQGSLTTPPCTEGVSWVLMQDPIQMSRDQIEAFTKTYSDNYRPVQPIGDRKVTNDKADR